MGEFEQFPSHDFVLSVRKMIGEKESREVPYQEAQEAADNLLEFFHLLYKIDQREKITKNDTI